MLKSYWLSAAFTLVNTMSEIDKEFDKKAEEARKKYWDACKYPRKKKKQMRKEAKLDYNFYKSLNSYSYFK